MPHPMILTRRAALLGAIATLGGCSALSSLNKAATPLDTYDLVPVPGSTTGRRSGRTILVARPTAPAAIATDRIVVKPDALAITYLPDARWADELPAVMQSLLVRSIAGTGRVGYVGPGEGGPVPDVALLSRIDAFQVEVAQPGFSVVVDLSVTLVRDRDQSVIATRVFRRTAAATDDLPTVLIPVFQTALDAILPEIADWVAATA
ncbi:ABC-type transport auxiliary lipoprotein family protein [Oceaniglobus indicus]|uniref:ABC-type transport auxiliary lipoprotein family protein n=1 Tax=Oceaniglobus indicus TaxID=2047749 RepID=UPI001F4E8C53|nr:ABC-type transport auxiliary lipoprotein family protein [Oceaniglobus indicus]